MERYDLLSPAKATAFHHKIADYLLGEVIGDDGISHEHPFMKAWFAYEKKFGSIEVNSEVYSLLSEAMRLSADYSLSNLADFEAMFLEQVDPE